MSPRTSAQRSIDLLAYPDLLERTEAADVVKRRQAARVDGAPSNDGRLPVDTVGFGLSGGGVRSATFSLGVFQALARAACLGQVDFLSTVSGGGYFGSFLGRLFTREWIGGVADVENVLQSADTPSTLDENHVGWGARVFRWLRDNGRYLAPRGSGDVLLLGAILLRNWVAVQVVLVVTVLTAFVVVQGVREAFEQLWAPSFGESSRLFWWSPWVALPVLPLLACVVPYGWAYWLVSRERTRIWQLSPRVGVLALLLLALAGVSYYRDALYTGSGEHSARFWTCAVVAVVAILAFTFYRFATRATDPNAFGEVLTDAEKDNFARMRLSKRLSLWLQIAGGLLVLGLVDTVGQTLYAVLREGALATWSATVMAAFAAMGSFARPLSLLLAPKKGSDRPGLSTSTLSWLAAIVIVAVWLVGVNIGSHAVRWGFHDPCGVPASIAPSMQCDAATRLAAAWFLGVSAIVLGGFTFAFGQTRIFANLSSVQAFYSARLIRTFLGASNAHRLRNATAVSDTIKGDDLAGDTYWNWPVPASPAPASAPQLPPRAWDKGGPLHIVNTTVNETVDARSGIQNQDRKGTGLAVGPHGLSLGIRHHLVSADAGWQTYPADDQSRHSVWNIRSVQAPEALSLGRWMSISGAAFSAAAGANTTVPMALLAGMFNVRLGFWWDSGVESARETWFEQLLPVQAALAAEMLARTRGTAGRLWNLSDGGHFENMAGYELIRRRLPVIVIVDAEADPDYTFEGMSGLVRKARLDFKAEIVFLNVFELDGKRPDGSPGEGPGPVPQEVRPYFGDLDALRRGTWKAESLTDVHGEAAHRYAIEPKRTRPSKAHAALARVCYGDPTDPNTPRSWLVYVKATLMGDEPEDVLQYHSAHPDFPQEPTSDQFFDEAQWESYRRLGEHIGERVLKPSLFDYLKRNPPKART